METKTESARHARLTVITPLKSFEPLTTGSLLPMWLQRDGQPVTPVIGFLSAGTFETNCDYVAAFHRGLADGGFAEGRNVGIEYRWTEGQNDRLPALAAHFRR